MNSTTHKLITATLYPVWCHFAVPNDWKLEDIQYEGGHLLYKGKIQYVPYFVEDDDSKKADKLEEGNCIDFDLYFDCEDD